MLLSWFWGDILRQEILNLHDPDIQYYCTVWWIHYYIAVTEVNSIIYLSYFNVYNMVLCFVGMMSQSISKLGTYPPKPSSSSSSGLAANFSSPSTPPKCKPHPFTSRDVIWCHSYFITTEHRWITTTALPDWLVWMWPSRCLGILYLQCFDNLPPLCHSSVTCQHLSLFV